MSDNIDETYFVDVPSLAVTIISRNVQPIEEPLFSNSRLHLMDQFEDFETLEEKENQENRQRGERFQSCSTDSRKTSKRKSYNLFGTNFTSIKQCSKKPRLSLGFDMALKNFGPLGGFHVLPDELFVEVLNKCSLAELGNLCLTHKRFGDMVLNYFFFSKSGAKALLKHFHSFNGTDEEFASSDDIIQHFSAIGLLIKKATILMPTSERIDILMKAIVNTYGLQTAEVFLKKPYKVVKFILKCYGAMIESLISGWSDEESLNVYDTLRAHSQLDNHIQLFLQSFVGSKQTCELFIRCFCRMVCNSFEQQDTFLIKLKWFMQLTSGFDIIDRAKMMIVVFGPLICISDIRHSLPFVGWWDLCDSNFIKVGLEDLALTLRLISSYSPQHNIWDHREVAQLSDVITQTPDNWLPINIGIFYSRIGNNICRHRILLDMKKLKYEKAITTLCYTTIALYKIQKSEYHPQRLSDSMKNIGELVEMLIDMFEGNFLSEFFHYSKKIILDLSLQQFEEQNTLGFAMKDMAYVQCELVKFFTQRLLKLKKEGN